METWELEPQLVTALWGGRRLAPLYDWPYAEPLAEAWLVSDLVGRSTPIKGGAHQGETLRSALGHEFPLLVKLIDAQTSLSVQVHPDDVQARASGVHGNGKTEAWVIVDAAAGSRVYAGLRNGVTLDRLRAGVETGAVDDLLHSFEPAVGDIVYLPAGTVHALGGGITIFEVQQSSDVTYRLHDWGRTDPKTGQPRALHIEEALACADFDRGPIRPSRVSTIRSSYFELTVHRQSARVGGDGRPRVLAAFGGRVTGCCDLDAGAAVLIPAATGECQLHPEPGAWLFEIRLP